MDVVKDLQKLGGLLAKCREMPAWFLDSWGMQHEHFYISPEPDYDGEGAPDSTRYFKYKSGNNIIINQKNYPFRAVVLRKNHYKNHGVKTEFDKESTVLVVYYFTRQNIGCIGEYLNRAVAHSISEIDKVLTFNGTNFDEALLEVGRNEHFNPCLRKEEYNDDMVVVGELPMKMAIVPHIPSEDLFEITRRFEDIVRCYEASKDKN